jgi:serine/threonine-protein kinase
MPQPQVRRMLDEVLGALATAHAAGVLHRDIKPGNILVARDAMKVADFGIAKTAGAAHTATGQIVGTMAYMSPERVAGAPASVADDLYAVAAMGFEALTGARPFPQQNPAALVQAIMAGPPVPLRAVQPDVDPVLASVIDRAMARDPGARFASAEQMRSALAGSRPATMVLAAPVAPSATYVVARRGRRRPLSPARKFVLAAAAFVGLIVTLLAVALDPSSTTQPPQPVSTSTTVPPPVSVAPPPPSPSPSAVPVIEQPTKPKKAEPGHGGGPGRGNKKHD